jgi:two-component system, OmpR family, phosphate regulon sensor histidine kinase PhoR
MFPKKLIWQLYLSYLLIMGIPVLIVTWYSARSFKEFYMARTMEDLRCRAVLLGPRIEDRLERSMESGIDSLCKAMGAMTQTRYTVISPTGKVFGDSEKDPDSMENHADRAEFIAAISGKTGQAIRHSYTLEQDMIYVAVPLTCAGKVCGVIRTSLPAQSIQSALSRLYVRILWAVFFMALFAALISFLVSRKISLPIGHMRRGAQRFASGDFSVKLPLSGYEETDQLAVSLNDMARTLHQTITGITAQRNELDAILSSMIEGVIAVDSRERIMTINRAASRLFGIDPAHAVGRMISEVLRNGEIQDFFVKTLSASGFIETETVLIEAVQGQSTHAERILQLHGSALHDSAENGIGALVVFNDITQLKKLENMRKDFVANVSHELRTPLTSIKGFVETLLAGAMKSGVDTKRFLGIISGQVDRLTTIVEDLLALSKIEQDTEHNTLERSECRLANVLAEAVESCADKASQKQIVVALSCDPAVLVKIDKTLFEQAIVNLIDNAINYSDPDKRITVNAERDTITGEIAISVRDEGIGIAPEHLGRLFERFYRVDKSRSRKLGGTGLGLSIVKHIALAHGGRVAVESAPGKGSVFYIYLPAL